MEGPFYGFVVIWLTSSVPSNNWWNWEETLKWDDNIEKVESTFFLCLLFLSVSLPPPSSPNPHPHRDPWLCFFLYLSRYVMSVCDNCPVLALPFPLRERMVTQNWGGWTGLVYFWHRVFIFRYIYPLVSFFLFLFFFFSSQNTFSNTSSIPFFSTFF